MRWQFDDDTTDMICASRTGGDSSRRSTLLQHEHGIRRRGHVLYLACKKKEASRKYSIDPCFNRSGEMGSSVVVRELDQDSGKFRSFYR